MPHNADRTTPDTLTVAEAERSEAEAMYALAAGAVDRDRLGIAAARIGGGIATSVRLDASRFWSKCLGLGVAQPVTAAVIREVVGFYREQGSTGTTFQLAPDLLPPDWASIAAENHLTAGRHWVKLVCEAGKYVPGTTRLRVAAVGPGEVTQATQVLAAGFGMAADVVSALYRPALARNDFQGFAAWDGERMVAFAAVRVAGETGQMYGAATLPEHRGRGAQTALLAVRAEVARAAGCRWLVAETGVPEPGAVNPSLDNMLRAGFEVRYQRRNWAWTENLAGSSSVA
jgi:ribosomal protein S18 acetylase RimI-like enzyme